jgi:hypothetical protein
MGTPTKSAKSTFQYDDSVTLNAQGHEHSFINRMQNLNITCVVIKCRVMESQWRVLRGHHHDPKIFSSFIYLVSCHQKSLCDNPLNVDDHATETNLRIKLTCVGFILAIVVVGKLS